VGIPRLQEPQFGGQPTANPNRANETALPRGSRRHLPPSPPHRTPLVIQEAGGKDGGAAAGAEERLGVAERSCFHSLQP